MVEPAARTHELIEAVYTPVVKAGQKLLAHYSMDEMSLIKKFLTDVTMLQQDFAQRLNARKELG